MEEDCMNILLQSMRALSLILLVSMPATYPMSWAKNQVKKIEGSLPAVWIPSVSTVQEAVMREARRAQWNYEAFKSVLPAHSRALAAGTLVATGLGALAYYQYNKSNPSSNNRDVSLVEPMLGAALMQPQIVNENVSLDPNASSNNQDASVSETVSDANFIQSFMPQEEISIEPTIGIETPLHAAVRNGDLVEVKRLLAELKTRNEILTAIHRNINSDGFSVTRLANELDQFDILEFLMNERRKLG